MGHVGNWPTWTGLRIDADGESQPLPAPQMPVDAAPGAPCLLVFRGKLGLESGAVVGVQVGCPPPPPPLPGQWYVYHCATFIASENYFYATTDPPFLDSELVLLFSYHQQSTGTAARLLSHPKATNRAVSRVKDRPSGVMAKASGTAPCLACPANQ